MLSASLMGSQQYHSLNTLDLYLSENDSAVNNHAGVNEAVCSTGTLVDTFVLEPAAPHTTTSTSLLELSKAPGKEINADLVFLEDRPNEICLYTLHGKPCKHPALCDFEYKICITSTREGGCDKLHGPITCKAFKGAGCRDETCVKRKHS